MDIIWTIHRKINNKNQSTKIRAENVHNTVKTVFSPAYQMLKEQQIDKITEIVRRIYMGVFALKIEKSLYPI